MYSPKEAKPETTVTALSGVAMDVGGPLHQMKDNVFSDSVKSLNGIFAAVQR